ncbi:hypothetical protein ACK3BE_32430 (plasmid) [Pseudomonas mandelii]|uniref:hypothetical protein n=1 Tax=Pseudomonas mandelii TaxID=75612 RepID=UPI00398C9465
MYFTACTLLLALASYKMMRPMLLGDIHGFHRSIVWAVAPLMMGAPIWSSFYDAYMFQSGGGLTPTQGTVSVIISLVGASLIVLQAMYGLFRIWSTDKTVHFWSMGVCVIGICLGGVGAVAAGKQLSFVDSHSGMVNFEVFRSEVHDMKCESDIIIANYVEGEPAKYRCPTGFLFNQFGGAPFAPWPDYTEGSSADLGQALGEVMRTSIGPDPIE